MVQQQGIVKGDVLQRIGSAGFIVGGVLVVIFTLLFPHVTDPSNTQAVLQKWGGQDVLTQVCALLVALGIWAMMLGYAGVYRSISARGAAWARFGFYGILIGATMWTVTFALHMATAGAAKNWLAAPAAGQATAYSVAASVYAAGQSVQFMSTISLWLAKAFIGIGVLLSGLYPRWFGGVWIVLGIATVAGVGIIGVFTGVSSTLETTFAILAVLSSLWALVVGIWVARKAW